jgi:hypothetical protein
MLRGEEPKLVLLLCSVEIAPAESEEKGGVLPRSEVMGGSEARRWWWSGVTWRGGRVGMSRRETK